MPEQPVLKFELKVGRYCCVEDKATRLTNKSKPGKHGSAKARLELVDIFTGQKISHVGGVTDPSTFH